MSLRKLTWWDAFKVADDSTDIRGWTVRDRAGLAVGEVDDLIFDTDDQRVRYLSIGLGGRVLAGASGVEGGQRDKEVLVPVGAVDLDEGERGVVLRDLTGPALLALPAYDGATELTPAHEQAAYRAHHPTWSEGDSFDYTSANYRTEHPRFRSVEGRFAAIMSAPRAATFAATEPDAEEIARRNKARDASGDWPA